MRNTNTKIIISTKCELLVAPRTSLMEEGFRYLEFLVSDKVDTLSTLSISEDPILYRYYFEQDGLYMYYRIKVPTKSRLENNIGNRLYVDDTDANEKLMIGEQEVTTSRQLEDVVDDDSPRTSYGISDTIVEEPIFSICRISSCLENMQRKYIFEGTDLSGSNCKDDSDKNLRDFLFSSIFILRLLIRQQRYEEALRILESISQCGILCTPTYTSGKNSCGCK